MQAQKYLMQGMKGSFSVKDAREKLLFLDKMR
jgi:hypothetical protein